MQIIKYLTLLVADTKAVFDSSQPDIAIKIKAVPNNVAIKFLDGKNIWCLDGNELEGIKDHIDIYISNVELEAGKGILQHWGSDQPISIVLSATQYQISELLKLSLNSQYIHLNVGGDDQEAYMEGSFTLFKEDYPIHSWKIEVPL